VRQLRNYGSEIKYQHPEQGFNSRLDTLQAVVLRAKLARLPGWNAQRAEAARRYHDLLADHPGVEPPAVRPGYEPVWHIYAVRVAERDRVIAELNSAGIGVGVHYPVPIHLQGAFSALDHRPGAFPHAERAAREMISLPIYPGITADQQAHVVAMLRRAIEGDQRR
jgi:dTDP-4-amino-4,6-dideoxygalactose transaminase